MRIDRNDVFGQLTPPPHGLARLRARLDEDRRRRFQLLGVFGAISVAVSVFVVAALPLLRPVTTFLPVDNPAILRLTTANPRGSAWVSPLPGDRGVAAAMRVSEDESVAYFLVASTSEGTR